MFSRRQSCRGKSQSPVVWIAEEMETEPSKPIDKISRGESTSHRAGASALAPTLLTILRRSEHAWRNCGASAPKHRLNARSSCREYETEHERGRPL